MPDPAYTAGDLSLFVDLEHAAQRVGVAPCLIGAGAVQLGGDLHWQVRLSRRTRDWDFAVWMESWERFAVLTSALTIPEGGFAATNAPQTFLHHAGGQLDVVPFGDLECPRGTLTWPNGVVMNTTGLEALLRHHHRSLVFGLALRSASLPAIVGLKVLAYLDRRPRWILRDIQDVHTLLCGAEHVDLDERIVAECMARLASEEIGLGETGAYLLGRDVGTTFEEDALSPISTFLADLDVDSNTVIGDIQRSEDARHMPRRLIHARLVAFRLGILDRRS